MAAAPSARNGVPWPGLHPAPGPTDPVHSRLSGPPPRRTPRPAAAGTASPPAGGRGRPQRRVPGLLQRAAREPRRPRRAMPPAYSSSETPVRHLLCPRPAPLDILPRAAHARQAPQRPPAGGPGLGASPRALRRWAALPPEPARREGPQAETTGTSGLPTLRAPARPRREPRAPNGHRSRPGPSCPRRRKQLRAAARGARSRRRRRRQSAAPAAAARRHLRLPLPLAFPSARRNATNLKNFFSETCTEKTRGIRQSEFEAQKRELT